jgi:ribosomal protein S18 acetylase RimI-like enzyme
MAIRRLRPDEWQAYRVIRLRALGDSPDAFGATLASEANLSDDDWQRRANRPDGAVFVADGPDGLVGLAGGGPAPGRPDVAGLFSMWVDPSARRQRLGAALVDAVKAWAIAAGYPVLGLGVTTTNSAAIALYRSLGFVETGEQYPLRDDADLAIQIMAIPLERPS